MKLFRIISVIALALMPALAGPAAAKGSDNAPFWSGKPDAAAFAKIQDQRLAHARVIVDGMLAAKGKRTLENTLRPYDDAMLELNAVSSQASLIENVHPDSAMRATAEAASQKVQALATEYSLNRPLYDALRSLDLTGADAETRYYVDKTLRDFRLSGVDKDDATRTRIKALRDSLVEISQEFERNIRSGQRSVTAASAAELDGLPADYIERHKPGADGKITLTTDYPDAIPVFYYAKNEDLRKRMYMEYNNRAYPSNLETLQRLIQKRDELAQIMAYPNYADYITADKMVGSEKGAAQFIDQIVAASGPRAETEYRVLLERKRQDAPDAAVVNGWESAYYQEMVRKSQYNFDSQSVRPYFPYDRVKQGVLDVTSNLFGVQFKRMKNVPVWDPSVECYEMYDGGKLAGRFYLDMHPRANKYTHAAQFDVRTGVTGRQIPEAALICNFPGGEAGDPGLMEHSDVTTFFHEFGHLLHTMFAGNHRWVGTGGIRTEHDFVEAPSQMLEEWTWDPAVLATFARNYQTGAPIPVDLVRQMKRANDYGKGLQVRRQMVYAQVSLSCYNRDPATLDTDALVKEVTQRYQPFPFVEGTHLQCAFGHLDGYSAVYYTYMWSLVIAKDMFAQFDRKNLLAPGVAKRYRDAVLAPGGSAPAATLVQTFLGRPFNNKAWTEWLNEDEGTSATAN
ncbi:MAG TPA: M3 family metallopeptidase [Candidatus Eisenbacteria bacterium]